MWERVRESVRGPALLTAWLVARSPGPLLLGFAVATIFDLSGWWLAGLSAVPSLVWVVAESAWGRVMSNAVAIAYDMGVADGEAAANQSTKEDKA